MLPFSHTIFMSHHHEDNLKEMAKAARTTHHYSRFDVDSRMVVDQGIALQHTAGTAFAAHFMQSRNIQTAVILRVLLRPHERRSEKPAIQ